MIVTVLIQQVESRGGQVTQSIEMPQDFPKRVHEALRAWHNRQTRGVLDDLFLAHQLQAVHEGTARLITNQIVADGLEQLKQSDADAAKLLERRFLDREKAFAVANSLNLGEDVVYQRQRIAIVQLAQAIWAQETEKLALRVHQIEDRLEPPTYRRLFGVEERIADVRASLTTNLFQQLATGDQRFLVCQRECFSGRECVV